MHSITCPKCGKTSYHPEDVRQHYCGNCHQFIEPMDKADFERLSKAIKAAHQFLMRASDGHYGPEFAKRAREELERERLLIIANYAALFERNATFRKEMEKRFTKRELAEKMKQSLEMNPSKELRIS